MMEIVVNLIVKSARNRGSKMMIKTVNRHSEYREDSIIGGYTSKDGIPRIVTSKSSFLSFRITNGILAELWFPQGKVCEAILNKEKEFKYRNMKFRMLDDAEIHKI